MFVEDDIEEFDGHEEVNFIESLKLHAAEQDEHCELYVIRAEEV